MKNFLAGMVATATLTFGGSDAGARSSADVVSTSGVVEATAALDVEALLSGARGAPALMCQLATRAVRGMGWGNGGEPPATRLPVMAPQRTEVLPVASVNRVVQALADNDPCVGEMASQLLATQPDSLIMAPMVERLSSRDSLMRGAALTVLGRGDVRDAATAVRRVLRDEVVSVRANAAWASGRLRDGGALRSLHDLVDDRNTMVRLAVVTSLGQIDSTRSVATLAPLLANDPSPQVRRTVAWAIGNIDPREGSAALTRGLRDRDASVREMAAWALGQQRRLTDEAGDALIAMVTRDEDPDARESAAWTLGNTNHRSAANALATAAAEDRSADVREIAAWAVGSIGNGNGSTAPSALLRALKDKEPKVRRATAWALKELHDPATLNAVVDALEKEDVDRVRQALVRAAADLGGGSDRAVRALVNSSDAKVRELAVRSLVRGRAVDPWPWPMPRPRPFP